MAFTTPKTWAVGDVLTAADMNTYVRSNAAWLATDKPRARVYHNATPDQSNVAGGTYQALAFNSELVDVGGMHNDNSRLTVPAGGGGFYLIGGTVEFTAAVNARRGIQIRVDGSTVIARDERDANVSNDAPLTIATAYFLAAGQYIELMAMHNAGATVLMKESGGYSPHFWAVWIGT